MQSEIARAETAEKANSDAITVINGNAAVVGSIAHALDHAKHYTDDQITALENGMGIEINSTLEQYAKKTDVDNRIKEVIGTAPEALNTLGEIAEVLNGNGDAITAINGVLAGKANSSDVYTKTEIDNETLLLGQEIKTESNRAKAAEKANTDAINAEIARAQKAESDLETEIVTNLGKLNDEVKRAKAAEKNNADNLTAEIQRSTVKDTELTTKIEDEIARSTAKDTEIATNLQTEITRATDAEKAINDKLDVINGADTVVGSIAHSLNDAKHYTDDEIAKLKGEI